MESRAIFARTFVQIISIVIVIMSVFGVVIYKVTENAVSRQLSNKCQGIAIAAATLIEQDTDGYLNFIEILDTDSEYYINLKSNFEKIFKGNEDNIAFLYAEIQVSDSEIMYIVDGETEGSDTYVEPGRIDSLSATHLEAYESHDVVVEGFVTTVWGTIMSVYVPVFDQNTGDFIGLVGADVSIEQYYEVMRYMMIIIIVSVILMISAIILTLLLSTGRVQRMMMYDSLTGVYNRSFFLQTLKSQVKTAKKRGTLLTVLMLDLDHFKNVNDTYGHPFGDVVLETVAKTISGTFRRSDYFARYGGEEFAAILPELNPARAYEVIDRIRIAVEETSIYCTETDEYVGVTISIGAATYMPDMTAEELLSRADKALYHAKITRNSVAIWNEGMSLYPTPSNHSAVQKTAKPKQKTNSHHRN